MRALRRADRPHAPFMNCGGGGAGLARATLGSVTDGGRETPHGRHGIHAAGERRAGSRVARRRGGASPRGGHRRVGGWPPGARALPRAGPAGQRPRLRRRAAPLPGAREQPRRDPGAHREDPRRDGDGGDAPRARPRVRHPARLGAGRRGRRPAARRLRREGRSPAGECIPDLPRGGPARERRRRRALRDGLRRRPRDRGREAARWPDVRAAPRRRPVREHARRRDRDGGGGRGPPRRRDPGDARPARRRAAEPSAREREGRGGRSPAGARRGRADHGARLHPLQAEHDPPPVPPADGGHRDRHRPRVRLPARARPRGDPAPRRRPDHQRDELLPRRRAVPGWSRSA